MKKVVLWIAAIFEDQKGSASSKRVSLFIAWFFMWMIVKGSLDGKPVDQQVLFTIA